MCERAPSGRWPRRRARPRTGSAACGPRPAWRWWSRPGAARAAAAPGTARARGTPPPQGPRARTLRFNRVKGAGGGSCANSMRCQGSRRPGRACCCTGERSRAAACIAPSAVSGCANAYLSSAGALAPRPRRSHPRTREGRGGRCCSARGQHGQRARPCRECVAWPRQLPI
jgi:hypothetical protein